MNLLVNGTNYDTIQQDTHGALFLSSTQHPQTMLTTMDELKTQYGLTTALQVALALREAR